MKIVSLTPARDGKHKYIVTLGGTSGKTRTVRFGALGYSDYTKHRDPERKQRYITRHKSKENWSPSGVLTPGFWSRWVLWNKPSLRTAISSVKNRIKSISVK
jgi:hypothetical protein